MPHRSRSTLDLLLVALVLLATAPRAFAYFDPGSGSLLLQMILGGVAGLAVLVRLYWHKLLSLFGKKPEDDEPDAAA